MTFESYLDNLQTAGAAPALAIPALSEDAQEAIVSVMTLHQCSVEEAVWRLNNALENVREGYSNFGESDAFSGVSLRAFNAWASLNLIITPD